MKGYFKKDRKTEVDITSSNDLPENALQWASVLKADDPEFSYKFIRT